MTATTTTKYATLPSNDMDANAATDPSPTTAPVSATSSSTNLNLDNESTPMINGNVASSTNEPAAGINNVATSAPAPPATRSPPSPTIAQAPVPHKWLRLLMGINILIVIMGCAYIITVPLENVNSMGFNGLAMIGIGLSMSILFYTMFAVENKDNQARLSLWIVFLLFLWYPLDAARIPCGIPISEDNPTPCLNKGINSGISGYLVILVTFHAATISLRLGSLKGTGAYGELHNAVFVGLLGVFTWIPRKAADTGSTVAPRVETVAPDPAPVIVKDVDEPPPPSDQHGTSPSPRRLDASDMV